MITGNPKGQTPIDHDEVIERLADAWAMDRPAVQRTLTRHAKQDGLSIDDLAQTSVLKLNAVAVLLRPTEPLAARG